MAGKSTTGDESFLVTQKALDWLVKGVEGTAGIAAADRREVAYSLSHFVQTWRSEGFLRAFIQEWDEFRKKSRIKEDYTKSDQHCDCLQEMLDFLDKESPDKERFEVLKKIFMVAATESSLDRNSSLPRAYMRICRSLSSGEVCVLLAAYTTHVTQAWDPKESNVDRWLKLIAEKSGLSHASLVESYETALMDKHLITKRTHSDLSGIRPRNCRLTDLGLGFCGYVSAYDSIVDTPETASSRSR